MADCETLGDHLKRRRLQLGLYQREVAPKLAITTFTLGHWEQNDRRPAVGYCPAIKDFLGYCPYQRSDTRARESRCIAQIEGSVKSSWCGRSAPIPQPSRAHGFLRVHCERCRAEGLVAFSCKRRGFCPSCGARRMAESAALLVDAVFPAQPVRQWVLSVPYPLRFLFASRPEVMSRVLGIVYRVIAAHLINKAGCSRRNADTGAVTLIQRFGSALNLNMHFHMLFLDGVYVEGADGAVRFRPVGAPTPAELTQLTDTIARRVGRYLERQGWFARDAENSHLVGVGLEAGPMAELMGASITYRIAVGPQQGRKVFTLQTRPAGDEPGADGVGQVAGLLRASCPAPFGPAFGCSRSLLAILSRSTLG